MYPPALEELMAALRQLPGIGQRSAERLALALVQGPRERLRRLANALERAGREVVACSRCHSLGASDPCEICADPSRDKTMICVVPTPAELAAIEASGAYKGLYFVLGGALAPAEGTATGQLRVDELVERVGREGIREVIVATSPTVEGDATASLLAEALSPTGAKVTRVGCGVPVGGEIRFMDGLTLARALGARQPVT